MSDSSQVALFNPETLFVPTQPRGHHPVVPKEELQGKW
jgi:hypothetical protein